MGVRGGKNNVQCVTTIGGKKKDLQKDDKELKKKGGAKLNVVWQSGAER